jgi:hypothetical protein
MMAATRARWRLLGASVVALSAGAIAGQTAAPAPPGASDPMIIRGIQIETHRIFDSAEASSGIYDAMNTLHRTTRPYVIQQQLLFKVGERWDSALVRETARNLRSLGLFRVVTIDSTPTDSGLIARVSTQDAWTFGIVFTIKSSGSQIGYAVGFNDHNVLGTGTQFQMQYGKNPDRDSVMFGVSKEFLFGSPYDVTLNYNHLSDGKTGSGTFGLPFRTLESTRGWTLGSQLYDGRVLLFYGGDTTAQDTVRRSFQLVSLNPAIALSSSNSGYLRLGLYAQIERNDFQQYSLPASQIPRTYTAAFGPFLNFSRPLYEHVRYYQAGGRREDLQLGFTGTFGVGFAPAQWGYGQNGLSPTLFLTSLQRLALGHIAVHEIRTRLRHGLRLHHRVLAADGDAAAHRLRGRRRAEERISRRELGPRVRLRRASLSPALVHGRPGVHDGRRVPMVLRAERLPVDRARRRRVRGSRGRVVLRLTDERRHGCWDRLALLIDHRQSGLRDARRPRVPVGRRRASRRMGLHVREGVRMASLLTAEARLVAGVWYYEPPFGFTSAT